MYLVGWRHCGRGRGRAHCASVVRPRPEAATRAPGWLGRRPSSSRAGYWKDRLGEAKKDFEDLAENWKEFDKFDRRDMPRGIKPSTFGGYYEKGELVSSIEPILSSPITIAGTRKKGDLIFFSWDKNVSLIVNYVDPNMFLTFKDTKGRYVGPICFRGHAAGWGIKPEYSFRVGMGFFSAPDNLELSKIPTELIVKGGYDIALLFYALTRMDIKIPEHPDLTIKVAYHHLMFPPSLGMIRFKGGKYKRLDSIFVESWSFIHYLAILCILLFLYTLGLKLILLILHPLDIFISFMRSLGYQTIDVLKATPQYMKELKEKGGELSQKVVELLGLGPRKLDFDTENLDSINWDDAYADDVVIPPPEPVPGWFQKFRTKMKIRFLTWWEKRKENHEDRMVRWTVIKLHFRDKKDRLRAFTREYEEGIKEIAKTYLGQAKLKLKRGGELVVNSESLRSFNENFPFVLSSLKKRREETFQVKEKLQHIWYGPPDVEELLSILREWRMLKEEEERLKREMSYWKEDYDWDALIEGTHEMEETQQQESEN